MFADRIDELYDGFHPPLSRFRVGQVLWLGVASDVPPTCNQRIEDTELVPVVLDIVAAAYLDLVRRPADPGGLALWSNLLDRGWSRMQVVQQMQTSQEYHAVVVRDLYRRVLGRTADSGANAWIDFLNRGGRAEQLEAFFLGSDEFFITHGSNNQGFLSALYQNVLERPIDPSAADSWGQALANGTSRAAVAAAVLASLEADRVETQTTYAKLLHRPPDPSGLDTFTYLLQQGVPNETVIAVIMSSDEYFAQI